MQGQNKAAAIQLGLSILPQLIQDAENYMGSGNGQAKHDLVVSGVTTVVAGAAAVAGAANPTYAALAPPVVSLFSTIIKAIVDGRKAAGIPVQPTTSPEGSPTLVEVPVPNPAGNA